VLNLFVIGELDKRAVLCRRTAEAACQVIHGVDVVVSHQGRQTGNDEPKASEKGVVHLEKESSDPSKR
jgi:hypothetical protein